MHNPASNNKHSHGVVWSEIYLILQCRRQVLRLVFTVTVVSKASWVVMDTMNNHTYNRPLAMGVAFVTVAILEDKYKNGELLCDHWLCE